MSDHVELDPINADTQGLIVLDGTGLPFLVLDSETDAQLAEYLGDFTTLQLAVLAARLDTLRAAVHAVASGREVDRYAVQFGGAFRTGPVVSG